VSCKDLKLHNVTRSDTIGYLGHTSYVCVHTYLTGTYAIALKILSKQN